LQDEFEYEEAEAGESDMEDNIENLEQDEEMG